jgi:hypothetical protein
LTANDIQELKSEKTGVEVVDLLTQKNSNFDQMTSFAKEKYIRRKMKKHHNGFTLKSCTMVSIADVLF